MHLLHLPNIFSNPIHPLPYPTLHKKSLLMGNSSTSQPMPSTSTPPPPSPITTIPILEKTISPSQIIPKPANGNV